MGARKRDEPVLSRVQLDRHEANVLTRFTGCTQCAGRGRTCPKIAYAASSEPELYLSAVQCPR